MFKQLQYLLIIWLIFFSDIYSTKLLANSLTNQQSRQSLKQVSEKNEAQTSIDLWQEIVRQNQEIFSPQELALIKSKIASSYFKTGRYEEAVSYWNDAITVFRDSQQYKLLATNLTDIAKAYLNLGQTRLATQRLKEAMAIAESAQFDRVLYSVYLTWSNINKISGKYLEAEHNLYESLKYAVETEEKILVHHNLSQVFQAQSQQLWQTRENFVVEDIDTQDVKQQAKDYLDKAWFNAKIALKLSKNTESLVTVDILLQILKLGANVTNFNPHFYLNKAEIILAKAPSSTHKVYNLINLSKFKLNPIPLLNSAVTIANSIEDYRSAAFANGYLGRYYTQVKQYDLALKWTNKAIIAASQTQAEQSLYQWYWEKGRIYTALGQKETAIELYNQAIAYLQNIRGELAKSANHKIDFATKVEPVYRELLQLLLAHPTSQQIEQALEIRDLLQLSELENFFGDDCSEFISREQKILPHKTAFIHTIIFPQATHVILKYEKKITYFSINITQLALETLVREWRYSLEDQTEENYLILSQKMYDLLIAPMESELNKNELQSLIFVNDGILKNVPMAALYDGQNFLIENYSVTSSLNLNLHSQENYVFTSQSKILAFGLSEETANFPALPYVEQEIQLISELVEVEQFLNSEFTPDTVEQELVNNNFRLIHFATHAQFGGRIENSFLRTYQGQISLSNLEEILNQNKLKFPQSPISLLVLSACETAVGNERAVLGLAGIAIRSGVLNVIGSLWAVNDRAVVYLINDFYNYLLAGEMSPSEALRQTQIKMIREGIFHPAIWSNLILIAN